EVALKGEEVLIAQNDQPVLKLIPICKVARERKAGSAKGLIKLASDFDAPIEDFRTYTE
ncbi:MAG: DUF2281 domain-containing protein, partial [Deltaproteobacteria bacterium]|nr:DUF2281 domain-containing protein [Deltaproteobacteria bacterium]